MKDNAIWELEDRSKELRIAHKGLERILPTNTGAAAQETIKKTMNVMVDEIEAVSTDIAKLQLSGRGFETYKIKGVDKNVRNCFS
jgi:hypothetical protein